MKMTNCENCYHYNVCSGRPDVETYGCKCDDYKEELEFINKYMANPKVYVFNRKKSTHVYLNLYKK